MTRGFYVKLSQIISAAKSREVPYSLTHSYVWRLFRRQKGKCKLTGLPLVFNEKLTETTASLDRIDSSKGYVPRNVQWVHKTVNLMKWKLRQKEFVGMCKLVARKCK